MELILGKRKEFCTAIPAQATTVSTATLGFGVNVHSCRINSLQPRYLILLVHSSQVLTYNWILNSISNLT
jgi:hypothetical protein